jgi:SAM-dependent methyltransferase
MAHAQQLNFIGSVNAKFPNHFTKQKVLEIGSYNVNGSVRPFFKDCDYLGIDVAEGKEVDLVCKGEEFNAEGGSFDVVISCECLEHNPEWIDTFANMLRLTRPGGLVIMTCATVGRAEHGTTRTTPLDSPLTISLGWDYYRNLVVDDFTSNFDLDANFEEYEFEHEIMNHDLYFWGIKQ